MRIAVWSGFLSAGLACFAMLMFAPEARASQLTFQYTFVDDASMHFASRGWMSPTSLFQQNIRAAADIWGVFINSSATIRVQVEADNSVARTGGTFSNGRFLGTDAAGNSIFEPGPLSVILSGSNPGGPPDLFLRINSAFVAANYWFDPTPQNRTDQTPPIGKTDFVSIILHEMGHGFGVAGTRNFAAGPAYGTFPGYVNPFDVLSYFGGNGNPLTPQGQPNPMFFKGSHAASIFGSDTPLSHVGPSGALHSQDFYHLGTCGDPPILSGSLMNGCSVPTDGTFLVVTMLDRALLADLGYPIPSLSAVEVPSTHTVGKVSNSVLEVHWNVALCPSSDYNLFYGDLTNVSIYAYSGAVCGLGVLGSANVPTPSGNVFWFVAGVGPDHIEGPHGRTSAGTVSPANAGGLCAVVSQNAASTCP